MSELDSQTTPPETVARFLDISEEAYHADPCPTPSLSSSMAKTLLDKSPLHAWQEHPRLGGIRREPTASMDRGALIHMLVLGVGARIEIVVADDWRTKAAREQRDAARKEGKIPVLAHEHDDAREAAERITKNLRELGVELSGRSEVSMVWQENAYPGTTWCRGRMDHLIATPARATIYDLKSSRSAHPKACVKHVIDYGYTTQRAAYVRGLEQVCPHLSGRVDFAFLFAEVEPPYAVTVARLDGALREHGERRWSQAVQRWALCLRRDSWPGYAHEPQTLEAPGWLLSTMEEVA